MSYHRLEVDSPVRSLSYSPRRFPLGPRKKLEEGLRCRVGTMKREERLRRDGVQTFTDFLSVKCLN